MGLREAGAGAAARKGTIYGYDGAIPHQKRGKKWEIRAMARVRVRARFSTKAMTRVTARQSREEAAFRYDGKILYQKRGKKRGN